MGERTVRSRGSRPAGIRIVKRRYRRADNSFMLNRLSTCVLFIGILSYGARADAQFRPREPVVPGEDYHAEFGLNWWTPTPELAIGTDSLDAIGTDIDFVDDFGFEKQRFNEFKATLKPGRKHKIRFQYVAFKYDADAQLQRSFVFNGRRFDIGLPATAAVDWDLWRIGYEWDFVSRNRGFVGLLAEMKWNHVKADITSPIGNELTEATAPVPVIGGIGRGYVTRNVSVTAEFTAFKFPNNISHDFEAKIYDFDVYGTINMGRNLGVQAGFRSLTAEYLVEEDSGDLKMKGPYFGGVIRF
jgi:hypothetical protein